MADYYPLIARAVEGLSDRSPPMRRAVYERARSALIDQLRSLDPPLAEADIERERLSLEGAIERVEAENSPAPAKPAVPAPATLAPATLAPAIPAPAIPAHVARPGAAASADAPAREPEPQAPAPIQAPAAPLSYAAPGPEEAFETYPWEAKAPASGTKQAEPPQPAYYVPPSRGEDFEAYLPDGEASLEEPAPPARPRVDSRSPTVSAGGRGRAMILGGILVLVIGVIAVAAWLLRDTPAELPSSPPVAEAPPRAAEGGKIAERVGGGPPLPAPAAPAPGQPASRQEVTVAQRAVFYEEDPANPQAPKTLVGRVVWRLEGVNAGQGQPLESAVRAVIEIPDGGLTMNLLIRRNLDATLPASHTVELSFTTRAGDAGRVVRDVGLLQFKNEEGARGTPVAGLPVPVRENLFLIGLSNLSADVERNVELLVRRNWIDLPIRMASGQRAILSFEKGVVGEQVMNDAFRQWQ